MSASLTSTGVTYNDSTSQATAFIGGRGQVFDGGCVFTASKATTVLTVTAVQKGTLYVGQTIFYNNATMTINSFGTGSGGTGTYNVSVSGTVSSRPWSGGRSSATDGVYFTIPTGITSLKVTVVGGGGCGGNTSSSYGIGGGAGGVAIKYLTGLTPGATLAVTVGYATGTSSVSSGTQSISTISATGGANGGAYSASTGASANGASGGLGSGGDFNAYGQASPGGVHGQGCAYVYEQYSGTGAPSVLGGSPSSVGFTTQLVAGINALHAGAGGTPAMSQDATTRFGGMGGTGVVIFEW